jgi:hypothetical protein
VKFTIADAVAQVCDATGSSTAFTGGTATGTASFTGFGAANNLGAPTFTPNPIPANGVSTSSVAVCVRDASGNKVTSGTGSTDSISLIRTGFTGATASTTLITTNPQTATGGCATFTVQSTTVVGTDTYSASDVTRSGITPAPTIVIGAN